MKRVCTVCWAEYDDEFRTTLCPHDDFPANDGANNFAYYGDVSGIRYLKPGDESNVDPDMFSNDGVSADNRRAPSTEMSAGAFWSFWICFAIAMGVMIWWRS